MDEELTDIPGVGRKFTADLASPSLCKRVLSIEIPDEEMRKERERIEANLRREIKVPGFRKGKVPLQYIKKNFGDAVRGEAVQNLLPRVFQRAVLEKGIQPLAEPKFENLKVEEGKGISVEAAFEVRPEVEIKGYDKISIQAPKREVGESQVEEVLQRLRERTAVYQAVERPAGGDDFLIVDYVPLLESGEPNHKARQKNQPMDLSSEVLLPAFREGLIGLKAGDKKKLKIDYPADFAEKSLAGKDKVFEVTVTEVKEKLLPELDDAFAQQVGESGDTLEALKSRILEGLRNEAEEQHNHEVNEKIIDKIIEANEFEVPEAMIENYLLSIIDEDRRRRPGVADEAQREREIRELFRDAAVRTIRKYIILEAVGRQEKLAVSGEEIEERVKTLAEKAGKPLEEVKKMFADIRYRKNLENEMLDQKILNFLRENADIKVA